MGRMERGKQLVDAAKAAGPKAREIGRAAASLDMPWARCGPARAVRETIQSFILGPAIGFYVRRRARGSEHFARLKPPVILVANHSSHLDTPIDPARAAAPVAPAHGGRRGGRLLLPQALAVAASSSLLFNTVPISRRGGGAGQGAADHIHRLIDQRWNLLLYPEGTRSRDGEVGKLRSGAAVLAHEHGIPIVPIYVSGTRDAMPPGRSWPRRAGALRSRRHRVEVRFGRRSAPGADRRRRRGASWRPSSREQAAADESRAAAAGRAAA